MHIINLLCQNTLFWNCEKVITYPGADPGEDEEGGEDDDAKGDQGQEAHAPLQVEGGQGAATEGSTCSCLHHACALNDFCFRFLSISQF